MVVYLKTGLQINAKLIFGMSKKDINMRLSPSKFDTYRECPRKYRFRYIDRLGPLYRKSRPYLTMGTNVHAALKDFFDLPLEKRKDHALLKFLEDRWEQNRMGFRSEYEEEKYKNRARLQLKLFAGTFDLSVLPLMTEKYVRSHLSGMLLEGVVDRVDGESAGAHVLDYKTGAKQDDISPLSLYMYALILYGRKDLPSIYRVSFVFLESGSMKTWEFGPNETMQALEEILTGAFEISSDSSYAPRPDWWCRGCDFLEICPEGQEVVTFRREAK